MCSPAAQRKGQKWMHEEPWCTAGVQIHGAGGPQRDRKGLGRRSFSVQKF